MIIIIVVKHPAENVSLSGRLAVWSLRSASHGLRALVADG